MPRDEMRARAQLLKVYIEQRWDKLSIRQASFVTAIVEIILWRMANNLQVFSDLMEQFEKDGDFLTAGQMMVVTVIFSIIAGLALNSAGTDFTDTENAVEEGDEYAFRRSNGRRIPKPIKELLATLGIFVLACYFMYPYHSRATGYVANFMVSYMLMVYRLVSTRLDDPSNREWGLKVPDRWKNPIWASHGRLIIPHHAHVPGLHIDEWPNQQNGVLMPSASLASNIMVVETIEGLRRIHPDIRHSQAKMMSASSSKK